MAECTIYDFGNPFNHSIEINSSDLINKIKTKENSLNLEGICDIVRYMKESVEFNRPCWKGSRGWSIQLANENKIKVGSSFLRLIKKQKIHLKKRSLEESFQLQTSICPNKIKQSDKIHIEAPAHANGNVSVKKFAVVKGKSQNLWMNISQNYT